MTGIQQWQVKPELGEGKRNKYAQKVVGREDRLPDDEGGHLIASIFKGSGSIDNLVPMMSAATFVVGYIASGSGVAAH